MFADIVLAGGQIRERVFAIGIRDGERLEEHAGELDRAPGQKQAGIVLSVVVDLDLPDAVRIFAVKSG